MRAAGVAFLCAAGVLFGCFTLQALGLPQASEANIIAARATVWLDRFRESRGAITVGGRWVATRCVSGWVKDARGRYRRGTELKLGDGSTIRAILPHTLLVSSGLLRRPVAALEAAGCTRVLADKLARLAQFSRGKAVRARDAHGAAAVMVRFPHFTLLVDPRSDRPLAVRVPSSFGLFRLARVTLRGNP